LYFFLGSFHKFTFKTRLLKSLLYRGSYGS